MKHIKNLSDSLLLAELSRRRIHFPIYEHGSRVRGKQGTHPKTWTDDYEATVIGFRYRQDGGIEYKVRCWRQNQHWWNAEDLELIPESELCASCRSIRHCNCKCRCCHG